MKLIAISQRHDFLSDRSEWRDSLDTEWYQVISNWKTLPLLIPNFSDSYLNHFQGNIAGLVLTGGGNDPHDKNDLRNKTEKLALEWALHHKLPILAVCRGLQFLNIYFGGTLKKVSQHTAVQHQLNWTQQSTLAPALSRLINVNSFHDFAIDQLASQFTPLAHSLDREIEAVEDTQNNILGIMWHPERKNGGSYDLYKDLWKLK